MSRATYVCICEPRVDCADPNVNRWYCMRGHADEIRGIAKRPGICPLDCCEKRGANASVPPIPPGRYRQPNPGRRPMSDCGVTLEQPCPFNKIGDRQIGDECKHHRHTRCSGFVGWYDTYQCECDCHRVGSVGDGRE